MASAEQDIEVDRVLVRTFVESRSEETFRRLYRRHTPAMLRLGQRLSWSGESIAEDAVQEAWVRAARLLPRFEWRSSLGSWLGGIVVLELRRASGKGVMNGARPEDFDAADDSWFDPVETIAVANAVRELPDGSNGRRAPRYRRVHSLGNRYDPGHRPGHVQEPASPRSRALARAFHRSCRGGSP